MMFVLPYFNRYFFRMTGRIYLGPMVTCLIFVMILITNTVSYLPLSLCKPARLFMRGIPPITRHM